VRGGNADDEAGCRDDAVVGAKHGGAQPADTAGQMPLTVMTASWHALIP
jgi:hypothetical protein